MLRRDASNIRMNVLKTVHKIIIVFATLCIYFFQSQLYGSSILRVYHHESYPPIEFLDNIAQSTGFTVDIFKAVAEVTDFDYTIEGIPWDSIKVKLVSQNFDVFTGLYYTHANTDILEYSTPLLTVSYSLFVRKGSSIHDLLDPIKKDVVILGGGLSSKLVNDIYSINKIKKVRFIDEALTLVSSGTYDCAVLQSFQVSHYLQNSNIDNIISVGPKLLSRNLCFAVPKNQIELLNKINDGIEIIKSNGKYDKIRSEWIHPYEERFISWRTVQTYFIGIVIAFIIISIGVYFWTRILKRAVVKRTVELNREIQERTKIEEDLRISSEQLSDSNMMKDVLLDIIAHDLKNPAGVISGISDMMISEDPKNEMVHMIKDSSDNLLDIIINTSMLAKIAVGDKLDKETIDLSKMILKIVDENQIYLNHNDMTIENELPESLFVHANPVINQIFNNYINNAIKYASIGKKIIITHEKDASFHIINVIDFGKTILTDDRKRIFNRSIQLDLEQRKGHGLGLAIARRIAELHYGEVGVKPNQPVGNIFYLKLPV